MATSFVLKKVETFPLVVEVDCPVGKGKVTVDCKIKPQDEFRELLGRGLPNADVVRELANAVHGAPGPDGEELQGDASLNFLTDGELGSYLFTAFLNTYAEHYQDARRKNGVRLPSR